MSKLLPLSTLQVIDSTYELLVYKELYSIAVLENYFLSIKMQHKT